MDPVWEPWYNDFMTSTDQGFLVDVTEHENSVHPAQTEYGRSLPIYHTNVPFASGSRDVGLPPSIQAAVANPSSLSYNHQPWLTVPGADSAWDDEAASETATNPRSFAQRSFHSARLNQITDDELFPLDDIPQSSADPRRDSGTGSSDDGYGSSRLRAQSYHPSDTSSLSHGKACDCETSPAPYHLIRATPVVPCKHEVSRMPSTRGLAPPQTSSSDKQSLPCPICPDKAFTGEWAQRNLNRHMESVHAPFSSPDGVRHIPCSKGNCPKTFRRDDARLVHERRSHPELNRAPATTRRKKSGEM